MHEMPPSVSEHTCLAEFPYILRVASVAEENQFCRAAGADGRIRTLGGEDPCRVEWHRHEMNLLVGTSIWEENIRE